VEHRRHLQRIGRYLLSRMLSRVRCHCFCFHSSLITFFVFRTSKFYLHFDTPRRSYTTTASGLPSTPATKRRLFQYSSPSRSNSGTPTRRLDTPTDKAYSMSSVRAQNDNFWSLLIANSTACAKRHTECSTHQNWQMISISTSSIGQVRIYLVLASDPVFISGQHTLRLYQNFVTSPRPMTLFPQFPGSRKGPHSPLEHFLGVFTFTMLQHYLCSGHINKLIYNGYAH